MTPHHQATIDATPRYSAATLVRLLPGDELRGGPVIGHRKADGSLLFEGMDDWLWELYEGHRPREELEGASWAAKVRAGGGDTK